MIVMSSKSGYLHIYSGKRGKTWKIRYCVLYEDGYFSIYHNHECTEAEKKILLKRFCKKISSGIECYKWHSMVLPKGVEDLDSLFSIKVKGFPFKKDYIFAAENEAECQEWVEMLDKVLFTSVTIGNCMDVFSEQMQVPVADKPT